MKILNNIFIFIIDLYKKAVSPHFPSTCRYYPSCSTYAKESFVKYNFLKAIFKSTYRVLRCNPFSKGGYDPVD